MANYREEHIRNNRRLARQVVGSVALLLALIGLFTVLGWIVGLVRSALDDSGLRKAYRDRLYGMVMLDPVAFDDVNSVDPGVFKQAAIWGTVYQVQNSGGSLDQYERDPDTGSAMIPALEVDTYIANLLGPEYKVPEGTFSTEEFVYQYDEEKQAYLVPVTSSVAQYTPTVEKISRRDGKRGRVRCRWRSRPPLRRPMPLWRKCRTRRWAQPMRPAQLKSLRPSLQSRNSPQSRRNPRQQTNSLPRADKKT